jgi:hypothetical protein
VGELRPEGGSPGCDWLQAEGGFNPSELHEGSPARRLDPWAAPFQRAPVRIACPGGTGDPAGLAVVVEAWASAACRLEARLQGALLPPRAAVVELAPRSWETVGLRELQAVPPRNSDGRYRYGTGRAVVESVRFTDEAGRHTEEFQVGGRLVVEMRMRTVDPALDPHATLVVAFHKEGIVEATRVVTEELTLAAVGQPLRVELTLEPLLLCDGDYLVSVLLAEDRYYWRPTPYFAVSPRIHDFWLRSFRARIGGGHPGERGGVFRHPARWSFAPREGSGGD